MMSKSARAEQVRDYFVECERRALAAPAPSLPQTYAAALRTLAAEVEEKERLALARAVFGGR